MARKQETAETIKSRGAPERFQLGILEFASLAGFILVLVGFGYIAFSRGGVDYRGYHAAAMLVLRGGNPYDYAQLAPVLEEIAGFQSNNPFFYPPWYVLPFLPLALLPFQAARAVWIVINLVLFVLSVEWIRDAINWKLDGWRRWLVFLGAFLTFGAFCLISEQAGILLLFGAALALRSLKYDRPALAGLGLVILFTKPQATIIAVAVLGLWMFLYKRKSVLWALACVVILTVIASIAMPNWWSFESKGFGEGLIYQLQGPGQIEFRRVYGTIYDYLSHSLSITGLPSYLIAALLGVVGLALVGIAWFKYKSPEIITGTGILLTLLVTPYALQYDYVPLIVLVFWLQMRSLQSIWQVRLAVILLLLFVFSVLIWQEWSYQGYWQVIGVLVAAIVVMASEYRMEKRPQFA